MLLNMDSVRVHTARSAKKALRASVAHTPSTASFLHSRSTGKLCRVERNHALKGLGGKSNLQHGAVDMTMFTSILELDKMIQMCVHMFKDRNNSVGASSGTVLAFRKKGR